MTAETTLALLPCPFCGEPGGRLYASGGIAVSLVPPAPLFGCVRCQFGLTSARAWNTRASPRDLLDAIAWIQAQASHVADNYGENSMVLRHALTTIADKCRAITREEG